MLLCVYCVYIVLELFNQAFGCHAPIKHIIGLLYIVCKTDRGGKPWSCSILQRRTTWGSVNKALFIDWLTYWSYYIVTRISATWMVWMQLIKRRFPIKKQANGMQSGA